MFRIALILSTLAARWPDYGAEYASRYAKSVYGALVVSSALASKVAAYLKQLVAEDIILSRHYCWVALACSLRYAIYLPMSLALRSVVTMLAPFLWFYSVLRGSEGDDSLMEIFFGSGRCSITWGTRTSDWDDEYSLQRSDAGQFMPQTLGLRRLECHDRRLMILSGYRFEPWCCRATLGDDDDPTLAPSRFYEACWRVLVVPYEYVLAKARKPPDVNSF